MAKSVKTRTSDTPRWAGQKRSDKSIQIKRIQKTLLPTEAGPTNLARIKDTVLQR
jgi:hypothetical protein